MSDFRTEKDFFLLAIGTSSGGQAALKKILPKLPEDLNAAICIVQHSPIAGLRTAELLSGISTLPIETARDGLPIKRGRVYVAPADHHLSFHKSKSVIHCSRGPRENGFRPSIDVLLRSAGASFRQHAIGIVLTGLLDDGSVGAADLRACGGRLIVQEPDDAAYPDLPKSVLERTGAEKVLTLEDMPAVIAEFCKEYPRPEEPDGNWRSLMREVEISQGVLQGFEANIQRGKSSGYSCPECGGPLWEQQKGERLHFRCHTGHGFSRAALEQEQQLGIEKALYSALRILEERARLLRNLQKRTNSFGRGFDPTDAYSKRAEEAEQQAENIRDILHGNLTQ